MSYDPRIAWPVEREEQLKLLWDAGKLSAQGIAHELGVSRNAVLGKAHRMGLVSKSPIRIDRKPITDARRLGLEPRPERRRHTPNALTIGGQFGQIAMIRRAGEFKVPVVRPGQSKTSPTYRNQLGFLPEMTVNQRRNMLAEAMRNTAALPIDEAQ